MEGSISIWNLITIAIALISNSNSLQNKINKEKLKWVGSYYTPRKSYSTEKIAESVGTYCIFTESHSKELSIAELWELAR